MTLINHAKGPHVAIAGRPLYLLDPKPEDFDPEPTAKALCRINRYAGNYGRYSVAQHAVLVSRRVAEVGGTAGQQLAALHHDDPEIVTGDIPTPVKRMCPVLEAIEMMLSACVSKRYLVNTLDPVVLMADAWVFAAEVWRVVPPEDRWMYDPGPFHIPLEHGIDRWPSGVAYAEYMELHERLEKEHDKNIAAKTKQRGIQA